MGYWKDIKNTGGFTLEMEDYSSYTKEQFVTLVPQEFVHPQLMEKHGSKIREMLGELYDKIKDKSGCLEHDDTATTRDLIYEMF